jgi:hypothetical protein
VLDRLEADDKLVKDPATSGRPVVRAVITNDNLQPKNIVLVVASFVENDNAHERP